MLQDLAILFGFHFIFDGLLQTRETARNKSTSIRVLFSHMTYIILGILLAGVFFTGLTPEQTFNFALINTILHGIIDWNIWNLYKYSVLKRFPECASGKIKFEYWEDSWFYHFILGDQLLHNLCYIITYALLRS